MIYDSIMINPGGASLISRKSYFAKLLNYLPTPLKKFNLTQIDVGNAIVLNNLKTLAGNKISFREASVKVLVSLMDFSKFVGTKMVSSKANDNNLIPVNQIPTNAKRAKEPTVNLIQNILPSFKLNLGKFSTSSDSKSSGCAKPGRHLYHKEVVNAVNKQILDELNACYAYLSMACYFARTDVALPGCQGFFMRMHEEEHGHALKFINYQSLRGAHVKLYPIHAPEVQDWECIEKALAVALDMEKIVKENLIGLHSVASKHCDISTTDLIEAHFMEEQERSICEIARLLKRLANMGSSGIGEYLFDKEMHRIFVKHASKKGISVAPEKPEYYL